VGVNAGKDCDLSVDVEHASIRGLKKNMLKLNNREKYMKKIWILSAVAMLAACSQDTPPKEASVQETAPVTAAVPLADDNAKLSYAIGMDVGKSLKGLEMAFDRDAFAKAVNDTLDDKAPLMKPEDAARVKQEFFQKRAAREAEKRQAAAAENKVKGETFLAENAKKEGVVVTDSGLQYMVVKEGDGAKPAATDKVKVHYRGTLIDGTEFDSSYKRGQPISFQLNGVIKGWTEGVQLMSVGSSYKFFIPSELAYGERGAGAMIGPDETLIFEVELLDIEK